MGFEGARLQRVCENSFWGNQVERLTRNPARDAGGIAIAQHGSAGKVERIE
jgi:hypothetical protein